MKRNEAIGKYMKGLLYKHSSMAGTFMVPIDWLQHYSVEEDKFTIHFIDSVTNEKVKREVSSEDIGFMVKKIKDEITEESEEKLYFLSDCPVG